MLEIVSGRERIKVGQKLYKEITDLSVAILKLDHNFDVNALSESVVGSVLDIDDAYFYDTPDCITTLEELKGEFQKVYQKTKIDYDITIKDKNILIKDILKILSKKDNHKDPFWLAHTSHLDKVYFQELPPLELRQYHEDLMDYENKKKAHRRLVATCKELQAAVLLSVKKNVDLRRKLHLPESNMEYQDLLDAQLTTTDLNQLRLDLSLCNDMLSEDNTNLISEVQRQIEETRKRSGLIEACNTLRDSIRSEARQNIELRSRLNRPDSNIDYDKLVETSYKDVNLDELKTTLSDCILQLQTDNISLNKDIQERVDFLLGNIDIVYPENIALVQKINLYLDFSNEEHRNYFEAYAPSPSQSLENLEKQNTIVTDEHKLFQKEIDMHTPSFSDSENRKQDEILVATKEEKKVTELIKANDLTSFNKPSSQLMKLFKKDVYSGTIEYNREHLKDIKRGSLASLDHFLNKGPTTVKSFQPSTTTRAKKYIDHIEDHFGAQKDVTLQFIPIGGGNEIGGSCSLLLYNTPQKSFAYLIDIGIRNLRGGFEHPDMAMLPSFGVAHISKLDGIFITHAHADHIGALFELVILPQYHIPIYMSSATKDIFQAITLDGIKFMSENLFTDISKTEWKKRIKSNHASFSGAITTITAQNPFDLIPGEFVITPYHAGHVIGALGYLFDVVKLNKTVLFTGDFTLRNLKSVNGANFLDINKVDTIICEGTNLSKLNIRSLDSYKTFADKLSATINRGGRVVIPAFSVGKAQEIVALLIGIRGPQGREYNIKIDGLAKRITEIYSNYSQTLSNFEFSNSDNADIIVSSSGRMKEKTAIEHHLKSIFSDNKSLLIKGSFFDEEYSGWASNYQLNAVKDIQYGGQRYSINCEIYDFKIPLHAELFEIENLINHLNPSTVLFVHTLSSEEHNIVPSLKEETAIKWPRNFQSVRLVE